MPCARVTVLSGGGPTRRATLIFPRREASRWVWGQVRVVRSEIAGFGLAPSHSCSLDWSELRRPVIIPLLGHTTRCESDAEAIALTSVLHGRFALSRATDLVDGVERGSWVRRGLFYALMPPSADLGDGWEPIELPSDEIMLVVETPAGAPIPTRAGGGASSKALLRKVSHPTALIAS